MTISSEHRPRMPVAKTLLLLTLALLAASCSTDNPGPATSAHNPEPPPAQPAMEFALIPAGEFQMGRDGGNDDGDPRAVNDGTWKTYNELTSDERPVTQVRISSDFYLGKFEVTQGQWEAVMGNRPSENESCGSDCPVEQVSWYQVQEFLQKLNEEDGGDRYRLPTEAEWEYAARAGTSGDLYGELDLIAWHNGNSGGRTHPIGQKEPNAFGLYDMIGNVWEWVQDRKGEYPGGTVTDPTGPDTGLRRVNRGVGWDGSARNARVSSRHDFEPSFHHDSLGFRVAWTAP